MGMNKGVLFLLAFFLLSFASAVDSFSVNNILVKVSLHQGETVVKTLTVTGIDSDSYDATVRELDGVSLSGGKFRLGPGEKKDLILTIDANLLEPGVYVGHILIENSHEQLKVPVVLEVESEDVFFDLNLDIPPQYNEINPGGKIVIEVKVFDLTGFKAAGSLGPSPVTLTYELKGIEGEVISVDVENIVVDKQAQLTKTFTLPTSFKEGDYFFTVTARHKSSLGTASSFLTVRSQFLTGRSLFSPEFITLLIAFVVFFFIVAAFIVYLVRDRNKLFAELYRYNDKEFKQQESLLKEQARVLEQKGLEPARIEKQISSKLGKIKASQARRVTQLKKLEQKGDVEEMKRKLALWKKEGYSTLGIEHKMNGISQSEMKKIMSSWKKRYSTEDYKNR